MVNLSYYLFISNESLSFLDCHGKVCLYNGTLDLNTCECQCSTYATGLQCEKRKSLILYLNIY